MTETEFNLQIDDILLQIEAAIEDSGADIDYETAGGVLSLTFNDRSKIIINRQTPVKQLWLATRQGGFHFEQQAGRWQEIRSGHEFFSFLEQSIRLQADEPVNLDWED